MVWARPEPAGRHGRRGGVVRRVHRLARTGPGRHHRKTRRRVQLLRRRADRVRHRGPRRGHCRAVPLAVARNSRPNFSRSGRSTCISKTTRSSTARSRPESCGCRSCPAARTAPGRTLRCRFRSPRSALTSSGPSATGRRSRSWRCSRTERPLSLLSRLRTVTVRDGVPRHCGMYGSSTRERSPSAWADRRGVLVRLGRGEHLAAGRGRRRPVPLARPALRGDEDRWSRRSRPALASRAGPLRRPALRAVACGVALARGRVAGLAGVLGDRGRRAAAVPASRSPTNPAPSQSAAQAP